MIISYCSIDRYIDLLPSDDIKHGLESIHERNRGVFMRYFRQYVVMFSSKPSLMTKEANHQHVIKQIH